MFGGRAMSGNFVCGIVRAVCVLLLSTVLRAQERTKMAPDLLTAGLKRGWYGYDFAAVDAVMTSSSSSSSATRRRRRMVVEASPEVMVSLLPLCCGGGCAGVSSLLTGRVCGVWLTP